VLSAPDRVRGEKPRLTRVPPDGLEPPTLKLAPAEGLEPPANDLENPVHAEEPSPRVGSPGRGALGRTRTCATAVRSRVLYPLSYEGGQKP
jgi:hypothetical protein